VAVRTRRADLHAAAAAALASALAEAGASYDGTALALDDDRWPVDVVGAAVVDGPTAVKLASRAHGPTVVVADLVGADARDALDAAGVGWLDRRGHLRLRAPGLLIDRDVAPLPRDRPTAGSDALRGAAAIGVAAAHLLEGGWGVRELARLLELSPAAVSKARTQLEARGLFGDRTALFATLAAAWKPTWFDLGAVPRGDGFVVGGTVGAARLGAPIIATAGYPVEVHVADQAGFERARLRYAGTDRPVARLALAPTTLVAAVTSDEVVEDLPVAHPLFLALDLAADPGRGSEALRGWTPSGWARAW
jgi:hypothetical protein